MAEPRFSTQWRAEDAASSLEALIYDYESRGRRLALVERTLRATRDQVCAAAAVGPPAPSAHPIHTTDRTSALTRSILSSPLRSMARSRRVEATMSLEG